MSTSSGNKTPKVKSDRAEQAIPTDWDAFAAVLADTSRVEFATWLDQELDKLESDLSEFVTTSSKLKGRR